MIKLSVATVSMGLLAAACIGIVLFGLKKALDNTGFNAAKQKRIFNRVALVVIGWLILVAVLTIKGFFANFSTFPPRPLILVGVPLIAILLASFTTTGKALLRTVPRHWLIYFQSFRIAVEIVLWMSFAEQIVPVQMTFEGRNLDIISGILALPVGWYVAKKGSSTAAAFLYNVIGLGLLLNIIIVAVLSMPTPFRYFTNEPANTIVGTFPFVYLPCVLVVLAGGFHILSFRQSWLLRRQSKKADAIKIQLSS
jgi:hypothetical protein